MNIVRLCRLTYAWLLHLYPHSFCAEFGEEMQESFMNAVADAAGNGALAVITVYLRELRDLPANLLRAHLANRKRRRSREPNHFSIHQPKRSAVMGALGFGLGLAVIGMVGGSIRGASGSILDNLAYYLTLGVLLWAIPGAIGGAALGLSTGVS